MKVKIKLVTPKKYRRLDEINFTEWETYMGMTEEQEEFYKRTYFDYLMNPERTREKNIYFYSN